MESLAHSELFFIIAAIALIVVSIVILVILGFIIYFLYQARKVTKVVKAEMIHIVDDVEELRVNVKDKAKTISGLISAASGMALVKKFTDVVAHTQKQPTTVEKETDTK